MSYFKIEKSGCCEHKGLCQVRADFYYDEKDKEFSLTPVKIYPKEGYQGKVNEDGSPVDEKDYQAWKDVLPVEMRHLPFHTHFIYFAPHHTDEEILFCFEIAHHWLKNKKPMKNIRPFWKEHNKALADERAINVVNTDFSKVKNAGLYSVK